MSDDSDPEASAMAAMMGFSSFGGPPAKKKRTFNSATDAFISGQELEKLDKGGKNGKGSGGNQIPLGKLRTFGGASDKRQEKKVANEEEISLDDDDDDEEDGGVTVQTVQTSIPKARRPASPTRNEEINLDVDSEEEGPQYEDTSHTPPALSHLSDIPPPTTYPPPPTHHIPSHQPQDEDDEQPQYMDTSLPPPITAASAPGLNGDDEISQAEKAEMQARIDRLLAELGAGTTSEVPPPASGTQSSENYPGNMKAQSYNSMLPLPPPGTSLPNRPMFPHPLPFPPPPSSMSGFSDTASMASSHNSYGRGRGRGGSQFGGSSHGGGGSSRGAGRGQRNEKWYEDYYDPSFNQNPWVEQEEKRGLEAKGRWLEKGHWIRS
jgi:uncharacterized membrane protein YgcG